MTNSLVAFSGRKWSGKDTCAQFLIARQGYTPISFAAPIKDMLAYVYNLPREKLEGITEEDRIWRETLHPHLRATEHVRYWKYSNKLEWAISFVYDLNLTRVMALEDFSAYIHSPHPNLGGKTPYDAFVFIGERVSELKEDWCPVHAMQQVGTEIFRAFYPDTWTEKFKRTIHQGLKVGQRFAVSDLRFENEAIAIKELDGLIVYLERPDVRDERYASHASEQTEQVKPYADLFLLNDGTTQDLRLKLGTVFSEALAA